MKDRLFIGSSTESLNVAYAVQANLENSFEVTVWSGGIFQLPQFILDGFDFALFVFAPGDITRVRGKEMESSRDNVIFEMGMFIGRLGRNRVFFLMPKGMTDLWLPTDLLGLTPATFIPDRQDGNLRAALGPACEAITEAAAKLSPLSKRNVATLQEIPNYDDNDILSLLESWLGARSDVENRSVIRFSEVDDELAIPPGSAQRLIETAASKLGYDVSNKGLQTILFKSRITF